MARGGVSVLFGVGPRAGRTVCLRRWGRHIVGGSQGLLWRRREHGRAHVHTCPCTRVWSPGAGFVQVRLQGRVFPDGSLRAASSSFQRPRLPRVLRPDPVQPGGCVVSLMVCTFKKMLFLLISGRRREGERETSAMRKNRGLAGSCAAPTGDQP